MGLAGAAGIVWAMRRRRRAGAGALLLFLAPGVGASGLFYWALASWYVPGEFGGRLYSSAIGFFGSWEAQLPMGVYLLYAGLLLAVYRPKDGSSYTGEDEILVLKQRNGTTGRVYVNFRGQSMKFEPPEQSD